MTPKEKAKELIEKFSEISIDMNGGDSTMLPSEAEQCALICVDEIIKYEDVLMQTISKDRRTFWTEVKKEIENH